jgi:hypothetical protein
VRVGHSAHCEGQGAAAAAAARALCDAAGAARAELEATAPQFLSEGAGAALCAAEGLAPPLPTVAPTRVPIPTVYSLTHSLAGAAREAGGVLAAPPFPCRLRYDAPAAAARAAAAAEAAAAALCEGSGRGARSDDYAREAHTPPLPLSY